MSTIDIPMAAPPVLVAAPSREPHPFGLFSVAAVNDNPNPRFQNGVEWEPLSCDPAAAVSGVCFDSSADPVEWAAGFPLDPAQGMTIAEAMPFAVYGWYNCSAFSHPPQEAEARARSHLALGEERRVEYAIAAGGFDNEPNFTGAVDLGGPYPPDVALGALEGRLGTHYGSVGAIHLPRSVVPSMKGLERSGQRLQTKLGNFVVAGAGYDLAGGVDLGAGTATLYATSMPVIMRSEVFVHPDQEFRPQRTNNNMTIYAWRIYLVGWECVTARVTMSLAAAGGTATAIDGGTP